MNDCSSLVLYIFIYSVCSILIGYGIKGDSICSEYFSFGGLFALILFSGLRVGVGSDFYTYERNYEYYASITWTTFFLSVGIEWIPATIAKICYSIFDENALYVTNSILAMLVVLPVYLAIRRSYKKTATIVFLAFLFLFYSTSFNIIKQYIAASFVFYGCTLLLSKDKLKFCVCVLIGMCCHVSAIIAFSFLFVWNWKEMRPLSFASYFFIGIAVLVCVIVFPYILTFLSGFIPEFANYKSYLEREVFGQNREILLIACELVVFAFFSKSLQRQDIAASFFLILMIISFGLTFSGFFNAFIKRIALYFRLPSSLYLVSALCCRAHTNERIVYEIGIVFYSVTFFFLSAFVLHQADLIPYNALFLSWF